MQKWDEWIPSRTQHREERGWRENHHSIWHSIWLNLPGASLAVATRRPSTERVAEHQEGLVLEHDERTIGERGERTVVRPLPTRDGVDALEMELGIHSVGAHRTGVQSLPDRAEPKVVLPPA
jgi:hypothetical protein